MKTTAWQLPTKQCHPTRRWRRVVRECQFSAIFIRFPFSSADAAFKSSWLRSLAEGVANGSFN